MKMLVFSETVIDIVKSGLPHFKTEAKTNKYRIDKLNNEILKLDNEILKLESQIEDYKNRLKTVELKEFMKEE